MEHQDLPNQGDYVPFLNEGLGNAAFSSGLRAGHHLNQRLRESIQSHKFVDFYDIRFPDHEVSYDMAANAEGSGIILKPKKRRELSEREFLEALDDFLAVYCEKYPNELSDLLSYAKLLKSLMKQGANWRFYDAEFRRDREMTRMAWTNIRIDLYVTATAFFNRPHPATVGARTAPIPIRQSNPANRVPVGYCFDFHRRDGRCPNKDKCTYKHECPTCPGSHPIFMCAKSRAKKRAANSSRS